MFKVRYVALFLHYSSMQFAKKKKKTIPKSKIKKHNCLSYSFMFEWIKESTVKFEKRKQKRCLEKNDVQKQSS